MLFVDGVSQLFHAFPPLCDVKFEERRLDFGLGP
jgi:hypothetical protein